MTTTHSDLIQASQAIGAIADSSFWYTTRLAERVAEFNGVYRMTVGELVELDIEMRAECARKYAEALV